MPGPLLVVMVPARDAAADLPGFLASVSRFADAVVALDDGSTDDTRAILERHPLVRTVLTNPRRSSFAGWDEPGDRNRLLDAARELGAQWVLSLDADERLAPDDGAALRAFVSPGGDADPERGYLLRCVRMIDDEAHYDDDHLLVGRLFAPRPDHRLPTDRALHFVPLPTAIPRAQWVTTTLRIRHLAALDATRREARFAKYTELDPDHRWQAVGYDHLLAGPGVVRPWRDRDPFLPVVAHAPVPDSRPLGPGEPALSVVCAGPDGARPAAERIRATLADEIDAPTEVVCARDRADGIARSRGRSVMLLGPDDVPHPGAFAAAWAAHRRGWPVVSASITDGGRGYARWAAHLVESSEHLPGRPSGPLDATPGAACSFARVPLAAAADAVGPDPDACAAELFRLGYGAYRESAVRLSRPPSTGTVGGLLRAQVRRGWSRPASARPGARVRGTIGRVRRWGGPERAVLWWVLPLLLLAAAAEELGAWCQRLQTRSALWQTIASRVASGMPSNSSSTMASDFGHDDTGWG